VRSPYHVPPALPRLFLAVSFLAQLMNVLLPCARVHIVASESMPWTPNLATVCLQVLAIRLLAFHTCRSLSMCLGTFCCTSIFSASAFCIASTPRVGEPHCIATMHAIHAQQLGILLWLLRCATIISALPCGIFLICRALLISLRESRVVSTCVELAWARRRHVRSLCHRGSHTLLRSTITKDPPPPPTQPESCSFVSTESCVAVYSIATPPPHTHTHTHMHTHTHHHHHHRHHHLHHHLCQCCVCLLFWRHRAGRVARFVASFVASSWTIA
jgi:hypothetical protein